MYKSIACLALALWITMAAYGQRTILHLPIQDQEFVKAVGLDEEQLEQLETIQADYRERADVLRETEYDEPGAKKAALKGLFKTQQDEMARVLREEQLELAKSYLQERQQDRKAKWTEVDKSALKEELDAYAREHIHPVMREQRAKLEEEITDADRQKIEELRVVFSGRKGEHRPKDQGNGHRKGMRHDRPEPDEAMKAARKELHRLTEKYETEIDALYLEIEPEQERWNKEKVLIVKAHVGEDMPGLRHRTKGNRGFRKGHFLLMPAEVEPEGPVTPEKLEVAVLPNPASENVSLSYELPGDGQVVITLSDESGNYVKTVVNEFRAAGSQRHEISLSGLRPGVYYFQLVGPGVAQSGKIVRTR